MKQLLALSVEGKTTSVSAESLEKERRFSIEDYMIREAGVHPAVRRVPTWIIDEKEWPYGKDYSGFWHKTYITIIGSKPYDENATYIHEALGHGGFYEHISSAESIPLTQLSEAFARMVEVMLYEERHRYCSLSEEIYAVGTKELTQAASAISLHIGKKGIIQLFYALTPQRVPPERAVSFCKELATDHSLLYVFGLLAARYGGEIIGQMVRRSRMDVMRVGLQVQDETVQRSSGCTEKKLMHDYLSTEFSLGDAFAQCYLRETRPSCLEELITEKALLPKSNVYALDRASALKWVAAHQGGAFPRSAVGMNVLDSLGRSLCSLDDLDGERRAPASLHRHLQRKRERMQGKKS